MKRTLLAQCLALLLAALMLSCMLAAAEPFPRQQRHLHRRQPRHQQPSARGDRTRVAPAAIIEAGRD